MNMNNNKKSVWVLIALGVIALGVIIELQVFESVRLLSPAMMVKWVLIGMVLIAIGIAIGARMKKTYVINNKFQWRVWVLIEIGVPLVAFVVAPLLLIPKMVVGGVLIGMALIALGVSIGAAMNNTKPK